MNLKKKLTKYTFFPEKMEGYMPGVPRAIKERIRTKNLHQKNKKSLDYPHQKKTKRVKSLRKPKSFWKALLEKKFSNIVKSLKKIKK